MTGKLADVVMTVRRGEQIARKYQPVVANPSTPAQVRSRAKLKALSQLSAVLGNSIAIPRQGNVSARNLFTRKNYPNVSYNNNEASIEMANVKITDSAVGFIAPYTDSRTATAVTVGLRAAPQDIDIVNYIAVSHAADGSLLFAGSTSVVKAVGNENFNGELILSTTELVHIYAYGVRYNSDAARTKFSDLATVTPFTVASLIATSGNLESDVTVTDTTYASLPAFASRDDGSERKKKAS